MDGGLVSMRQLGLPKQLGLCALAYNGHIIAQHSSASARSGTAETAANRTSTRVTQASHALQA